MEGDVFPNYFTFVSAFVMVVTFLLSSITIAALCCSDYDLELPVYLRIGSAQLNALLYSTTAVCHYVAGDAVRHKEKYLLSSNNILLIVAILSIFCGTFFLVANGMTNSHIRRTLFCQRDPALKRKVSVARHQETEMCNHSGSVVSSRSSQRRKARRYGTHLSDEMNLNYVNSYLGNAKGPSSHIPLGVLGKLDSKQQGRRVHEKRSGELHNHLGPKGFHNVGFKVPNATSVSMF